MNKYYFKIGHMFLELYNDNKTNQADKFKLFETMQDMAEIALLSLIDEKNNEDFKKVLLDRLYKDKKTET